MAQTKVVLKDFYRVDRLSFYNHNVYTNSSGVYIREECDDYDSYYYYEVDANDKIIKYLGAENFSIFDSDSEVVFLDDYFC